MYLVNGNKKFGTLEFFQVMTLWCKRSLHHSCSTKVKCSFQMNLGTSIAVYASICKHLDVPFIFPGTNKAYNVYQDATDADLLAEHLIWEATDPKCANQVP